MRRHCNLWLGEFWAREPEVTTRWWVLESALSTRRRLHAVSVRTVHVGRQTAAGAPQFMVMGALGPKLRATLPHSYLQHVWRVWGLLPVAPARGRPGRSPHWAIDTWEYSKGFQYPCFALVTGKRYQCADRGKHHSTPGVGACRADTVDLRQSLNRELWLSYTDSQNDTRESKSQEHTYEHNIGKSLRIQGKKRIPHWKGNIYIRDTAKNVSLLFHI